MDRATDTDTFTIRRTVNAPRALVFKVWTDQTHLARWWGPKGFKVTAAKLDLKPGGLFHYCLEAPDGMELWGKWTFSEIAPPERLVVVSAFSDKDGGLGRHPMAPEWPSQMMATFTFTEAGPGKTTVTIAWSPLDATDAERKTFAAGHGSMQQGWTGTFEQLDAYLSTL